MSKSRLTNLKEYLARYKFPEIGDREEGYDGHFEWNPRDTTVLEAMHEFGVAVAEHRFGYVNDMIIALVPSAEDGRLNTICQLLMNTGSEEALKEALLVAITVGSRPLVEFILSLYSNCPYLERTGCCNSSNFSPHMTPLMLACILNNFSIVQCLLLRGHSIQVPHLRSCECHICMRISVSSRWNMLVVDVMRAISSEAFLWLATDDVFQACCAIAKDLQRLIREDELEFVECYRTLEANVQRFMGRLADSTWRTEEFNTIVACENHCARRYCELSMPRIQMALDARMRQFVCSANAQMLIKCIWRGDWLDFGRNRRRDTFRITRTMPLFLFAAILHIIAPGYFTALSRPIGRFMSHFTMFLVFLIGAIGRPIVYFYVPTDSIYVILMETAMYVYIAGLMIERLLLFYRVGAESYFAFWWRWLDVFLICSFTLSFVFFVGANTKHELFDPRTVDRSHWPLIDVALLHEVFLSISCVIGITKLFYYLQLVKGIGGSVISVGKCIGKVYTYLIIMAILIFSFSVGLSILVMPYGDRRALRPDGSIEVPTSGAYTTVSRSTKNLFWSIFGYLGPSTYTNVVGNKGPDLEPAQHAVNEAALEILGALYHGIIIITLLNLMTSLLVKKADEVLDNEEHEFKYTRAAVYSEFFSWEMAAPPPFNLLLLPIHAIYRSRRRYDLDEGALFSPSWGRKPTKDGVKQESIRKKFLKTSVVLFERFCASKECKYKSIWRSEFDKEEKPANRVAYLAAMPHPVSLDTTIQQSPMRKGADGTRPYQRKMSRRAAFAGETPNT